jgi:hypothetical protein
MSSSGFLKDFGSMALGVVLYFLEHCLCLQNYAIFVNSGFQSFIIYVQRCALDAKLWRYACFPIVVE